jgi:hypothetical protein
MRDQATFSLDDDADDDPEDEELTVSVDFFSAAEPLLELELALESLVLDSLALAGVVEELPFRLSVR